MAPIRNSIQPPLTTPNLQIVIRTEDDRVFYDMPEHSICNDCGACCKHFRVSFYQGELNTFPGGTVPAELTEPVTPFLVCMKGTANGNNNGVGRCVALQENNRCGIYENRPSPCREYAAYMEDGSLNPKCVQLRMLYGIGMPPQPLQAA